MFKYYKKYGYTMPNKTIDEVWGMFDSGKFNNDTIF